MHCPPISQALKAAQRRIIENRLARLPSSNAQILAKGRHSFLKRNGVSVSYCDGGTAARRQRALSFGLAVSRAGRGEPKNPPSGPNTHLADKLFYMQHSGLSCFGAL
jgi:hypothetical protein